MVGCLLCWGSQVTTGTLWMEEGGSNEPSWSRDILRNHNDRGAISTLCSKEVVVVTPRPDLTLNQVSGVRQEATGITTKSDEFFP